MHRRPADALDRINRTLARMGPMDFMLRIVTKDIAIKLGSVAG